MSALIPLQQAIDMTTRYRAQRDNILAPSSRGKNILPTCETFNRADIDTILAQPGCVSFRIYYGMDESLNVHAILVGVNNKDEDILPSASGATPGSGNGVLGEDGSRCPPICPPASPLNGG